MDRRLESVLRATGGALKVKHLNFTFLDGHASRFPKLSYWDTETDKGRPDNPEIRWIP